MAGDHPGSKLRSIFTFHFGGTEKKMFGEASILFEDVSLSFICFVTSVFLPIAMKSKFYVS